MIDISEDFFNGVPEDSSKKYRNQLDSLKPSQSLFLSKCDAKPDEKDDHDFWSMFFIDEHHDLLQQSRAIAKRVFKINEENLKEKRNLVSIL